MQAAPPSPGPDASPPELVLPEPEPDDPELEPEEEPELDPELVPELDPDPELVLDPGWAPPSPAPPPSEAPSLAATPPDEHAARHRTRSTVGSRPIAGGSLSSIAGSKRLFVASRDRT